MKGFPAIKTGMFTVAIAGFPNVGKTTLLYKLTGSKPEINSYAFTTKNINVSYIKKDPEKKGDRKKKIQFLDTPGTLDRPDKMNYIEKNAYLAITLCTDLIVYVFDLTLTYPIKDQIKLYETTKKLGLPMVIYFSKSDLMPEQEIKDFISEHKYKETFYDVLKLQEELIGKKYIDKKEVEEEKESEEEEVIVEDNDYYEEDE